MVGKDKPTFHASSHHMTAITFLLIGIIIITSILSAFTVVLNQNHTAMAQHQEQQLSGNSFQLDNMTFSHNTVSVVSNDSDDKSGAGGYGQATGNSTANISGNSLGQDLSSDGSFRIDGQRLYNLAIHNNYAAHYILIDVKGKGFQFYTFTFG